MNISDYQEFAVAPEHITAIWDGDGVTNKSDTIPLWSGKTPPPAIGSCVQIDLNNIGPCRVTGYFVEGGWLGFKALPLNPTGWCLERHGYNVELHLFGCDIKGEIEEPTFPNRPSLEQLAAVQEFANKYGRHWKRQLNFAWMDGADAREPNGHLLRQVRNNYGPEWLISKKNPIKPRAKR